MRKGLITLATALLLASCAPANETAGDEGGGAVSTAEACAARGGTWGPVGRLQAPSCVLPYADAGKACRDSDDCEGECRYAGEETLEAGQAVAGQCQVNSDRFGCFTRIEDGKAEPAICID
jgi:hypothetical protein